VDLALSLVREECVPERRSSARTDDSLPPPRSAMLAAAAKARWQWRCWRVLFGACLVPSGLDVLTVMS
jgi:hypothetical protein